MRHPLAPLALLGLLAAGGCPSPSRSDSPATDKPNSTAGPTAEWSFDDLQPGKLPYEKATLTLKGTALETDITGVRRAEYLEWRILLRGQLIESEKYWAAKDVFGYAGSEFEEFSPPIPLITQPAKVPSADKWEGTLTIAKQKFKASAVISRSAESLNIPGGPFETLKAQVDLKIENTGVKEAERRLTFWFAPGAGIVRRDFDDSSSRTPYSPPAQEPEGA